ncbi:VOC family protein [Bifidobacterium asteroides]|uniref:VOC family protein n=1 Tax=Bifidobacterium asteroides TaxID=1684 RepID=A0A6N7TWM5_9BIFI|nr:VOC family protein [Bifidobacterium asteroides]MSD91257.1 VOC family protein [Bifidobacterium asteroides]
MHNHDQPKATAYTGAGTSPVPEPGKDAEPPEPYRGVYLMPMFMCLYSHDLEESEVFWTQGLGFINLYTMPGVMIHLRRWTFQDVLLRKSGPNAGSPDADMESIGSLSVAVTEKQICKIVDACERLRPGSTSAPSRKPWNSLEARIHTPEGLILILTAALAVDKQKAQVYLNSHGQ